MSTIVFTFGRFNPVTIGHELLVNRVIAVAHREGGQAHVYLSHSQDKKKNPLSYENKISLAHEAFGSVVKKTPARNAIEVLKELQGHATKVVMVVGGDRVAEFQALLSKYNGKEYHFDSISVESVGGRDPDADDVSGVSASKARAVAAEGDVKHFRHFLPLKLQGKADHVMHLVRQGLQLEENEMNDEDMLDEHVASPSERRHRSMAMHRNAKKLQMGRERNKNRFASSEKIMQRSRRHAIEILKKIVAGQRGLDYANLPTSEKMMIDQMVEKKKGAIDALARKLIGTTRNAEMQRVAHLHSEGVSREELLSIKNIVEEVHGGDHRETFLEFAAGQVTASQMKDFEKFVDRMFEKYKIDFDFTKHFAERMNDERNAPLISLKELADTIKKIYAKHGNPLKGQAGAEAVVRDMQSDLNIPVAVRYDEKNDEIDVVAKTIMRKKNFSTPNTVIKY